MCGPNTAGPGCADRHPRLSFLARKSVVRERRRACSACRYGRRSTRIAKTASPTNPAKPVTLAEALASGQGSPDREAVRARPSPARSLVWGSLGRRSKGIYPQRRAPTPPAWSSATATAARGDRRSSRGPENPRSPATQFTMSRLQPAAGSLKIGLSSGSRRSPSSATPRSSLPAQGRGVTHRMQRPCPLDDQRDLRTSCGRGETVGLFQVESAGMKTALVRNLRAREPFRRPQRPCRALPAGAHGAISPTYMRAQARRRPASNYDHPALGTEWP